MLLRGIALGAAAAVLISLTNVFSRLHFEAGSNPVTFLLARYAIVVLVLWIVLAALGRVPRIGRRHARDLVIAGVLNVTGAGALAFAIERVEVSLAIAVLYLFPFFTLLFSCLSRRERPSRATLVALVVAFAGLVLVLGVGGATPDPLGLGCALVAAVGIAASFTWIERTLGELGDAARLFGLTLVGLGAAIALALIGGDVVWPLPAPEAWSTLLVATASFGAASGAMFMAIARIGALPTAMLMNLEPPATALLAVLVLGDTLAPIQLAGIALVVAAVLAAQRHARHRAVLTPKTS